MSVSDKDQAFAQAMGALARAHGAQSLEGRFRLRGDPPQLEEVSVHWSAGRHGSPAIIMLSATQRLHLEEASQS